MGEEGRGIGDEKDVYRTYQYIVGKHEGADPEEPFFGSNSRFQVLITARDA